MSDKTAKSTQDPFPVKPTTQQMSTQDPVPVKPVLKIPKDLLELYQHNPRIIKIDHLKIGMPAPDLDRLAPRLQAIREAGFELVLLNEKVVSERVNIAPEEVVAEIKTTSK